MIFRAVNKISDKAEKAFFIEKISIYVRLVEAFSEKHKMNYASSASALDLLTIDELISIGVIDDVSELPLLEKVLTPELYNRFLSAVCFYVSHKERMGSLLHKLSNTRRKELQEAERAAVKPRFVDFFAGAGGLSLGFLQAGFKVCLANDSEEVCIETYAYNHPELPFEKLIKGDIRKVADRIEEYLDEPIDVVVGGPPCQGFSSANQQRIIDDPRNELYKFYIKAVEKILPKFVVMENVRGMLKVAGQVVEDFRNLHVEKDGNTYSYIASFRLLNSVNFSVAQSRERLIYIAIRDDVARELAITPEDLFEEIEQSSNGRPHYILRNALEAIKPLDAPRIKNMNEVDDERSGKKIDVNAFTGLDNDYLRLINQNREMPYVFNHKARYVNDINYDIYRLLDQGDDATDSKIVGIMPYAHRNHCFKDKYYKLIADKPSRTITAHLRMDCHSHIHPFQIRALTPREAARCQSFPDDYLFLGAYLKTYMQIGNAVPVVMAREIANVIHKYVRL